MIAKDTYSVLVADCPTRDLLDRLSDKWVTLVLVVLEPKSLRFSELHRRIDGVSQKMLTQTLRRLEEDGLLTRTVTPTVPIRTDYELTALGRSLLPIVVSLKEWAETHMPQVQAHRDSRQ
jgi:DNA-binding HxlR family transcriptional regulator